MDEKPDMDNLKNMLLTLRVMVYLGGVYNNQILMPRIKKEGTVTDLGKVTEIGIHSSEDAPPTGEIVQNVFAHSAIQDVQRVLRSMIGELEELQAGEATLNELKFKGAPIGRGLRKAYLMLLTMFFQEEWAIKTLVADGCDAGVARDVVEDLGNHLEEFIKLLGVENEVVVMDSAATVMTGTDTLQ